MVTKEKLKKIFFDRRFLSAIGAVVLMAAISFIYFYPDDMEGNVLSQHDTRQGIANGQEAKAFNEATGEKSTWTNSLFSGMPTFQISPSYSSTSLFSWIQKVLTLGLPDPAGNLFLMMLGFFILLLALRMRWYIALIGAIAYGFSTYFIIIINAGHIWKFWTLAYIPPTIAGLVLAYRGRLLAGAALTALFGMLQVASNHVQMSYYFLFVVLGLMIAYLIPAIREKKLRQWLVATGVIVVAGVLAVCANLPSLYNTYEYSKETIRGGHSELMSDSQDGSTGDGLDRNYLTQYSYGRSETFSLLIPNIKGGATSLPMKGSPKPMLLADLDKAQEMISDEEISSETAYLLENLPIFQYFGDPEGTNGPVYVGALIVALFIVGLFVVKGPIKWVLLILTVFSILLALGRNCMWLTDFMIDHMPLYNKFRTPESILVIAEFTMPLLAMMALSKLFSGDAREVWDRNRNAILGAFGFTALICLAGALIPSLFGSGVTDFDRQIVTERVPNLPDSYASDLYSAITSLRMSMVRADSLRSLAIVAFGFGFVWLYFRRKVTAGVSALGIGLIILIDLFAVNKRYLNSDCFMPAPLSTDEVFAMTPADEAILADTAMNYRVMDYKRFGDADPSYYHKTIGGYHAAKLTRYQDILNYYFMSDRDYRPVLNMLNARYEIYDPNALPRPNPDAMGNAWLVDRVEYVDTPNQEIAAIETLRLDSEAVADKRFKPVLGESQAKTPGDTIFETSYAPNRLTYHVDTKRGGVAVFSEVYFPWGWHVTIDGKPVELGRVNYVLRALNVPAGSHTIEMKFDPESLHTTNTVATIAIIVIYLLLIVAAAGVILCRNNESKTKEGEDADGSTKVEI